MKSNPTSPDLPLKYKAAKTKAHQASKTASDEFLWNLSRGRDGSKRLWRYVKKIDTRVQMTLLEYLTVTILIEILQIILLNILKEILSILTWPVTFRYVHLIIILTQSMC
jgi:hypothetical protein